MCSYVENKFCDVEVKLTPGSSTRRQKSVPASDDAAIKNIDFVLLEDRDLTSNRVSVTVITKAVKDKSTEPVKVKPTANNKDSELLVMSDLSQIQETFLLEPHYQLG